MDTTPETIEPAVITPEIEQTFQAMVASDRLVRDAFHDAIALQVRAFRTRDRDTAVSAGSAFQRLVEAVELHEGQPVDEPVRRVLLELVGQAVLARGRDRLN